LHESARRGIRSGEPALEREAQGPAGLAPAGQGFETEAELAGLLRDHARKEFLAVSAPGVEGYDRIVAAVTGGNDRSRSPKVDSQAHEPPPKGEYCPVEGQRHDPLCSSRRSRPSFGNNLAELASGAGRSAPGPGPALVPRV